MNVKGVFCIRKISPCRCGNSCTYSKQAAGLFVLILSLVKRGVECVEILRVKAVGGQAERFTEMTHLNKEAGTPFPPRFQAFAYRKKADRIFFESGLLFCVFQSLIEVNAR